jgi:hypothetical protein
LVIGQKIGQALFAFFANPFGEVAERLIAAVPKTAGGQPPVSSNLTLSAILTSSYA